MAKLDLDKVRKRTVKTISTEEALKDIAPMEWPEEVLSGEKKVVVSNMDLVQGDKACVKLEISYV